MQALHALLKWYRPVAGSAFPETGRAVSLSGWEAASLQTSGSGQAEPGYHTVYDTLDVIELNALEMTAQAALRVVSKLKD